MLKNILRDFLDFLRTRTTILSIFFIILFALLLRRIFILQIVNGEDYLTTFTYRIQKEVQIEAPRGTIYDCNGVALAYNIQSYSISLEDNTLLTDNQTKNTMIALLINYIEETGNTLNYDIPLQLQSDGSIVFSAGESTILRFKKDVYSTEQLSDEQIASTAQEVYEYMRGKKLFNLSEDYDTAQALKILSVRFDLWMKRYEKYLSVTIAYDVSDELIACVKENIDKLPGVSITQNYSRVYTNSKYFSNITGYTGSISEEEYNTLVAAGDTTVSADDQVGKTGIEAYYDDVLRGTKGYQTLYVNSLGSILEVSESVDPKAGGDVYLSIDSDLQIAAYDMLEERIAGILLQHMVEITEDDNKDLDIPIKDFYFALIDNSVIDIDHLSAETATEQEAAVWKKYENYEFDIVDKMIQRSTTVVKELSDEYKSYVTMAYNMLRSDDVLNVSALNENDTVVDAWVNRKISFSDFLHHAVQQDIVDVSKLKLGGIYLDENEIVEAIFQYISDNLKTYSGFEKKVFYYMLQNDFITGREICLLLYEQNVLDKDADYVSLKSGNLTAYSFMYRKIYYLEITPDMLALDPCSGSYILTDIETGKVLTMVSYPSYDANQINNVTYFSKLVNNASSPFYNRVTQQAIAPGSTFKPISAIAGLEEGVITENTTVYDDVTYTKVYPPAKCWSSVSHGTLNITDAIMYSCNYFFYELGYRLGTAANGNLDDYQGLDYLTKYASLFGLDTVSGLELPETTPHISDESAVRSAIGQGTHSYTAAELCRYVTAIANSGDLYALSVVQKVTDAEHNVIDECEPKLTRHIDLDQNTWDIVHNGMYKVCNVSSYKKKMSGLGVTIAGKSGTAQESELKPNHGLFIGYAPYENPEIAAVVIIPNGHGSSNVLDLYADLVCYYFSITNTQKVDENGNVIDQSIRTANIPEDGVNAD